MPFFNSHAEWAAGIGSLGAWWGTGSGAGTLVWSSAGGTDWMTDDVLFAQHCPGAGGTACVLKTYNVRTHVETTVAPRGANRGFAGGGVWAAWLAGYGVYSSTGLYLPSAGLEYVGPDGAIATKRLYAGYGPYDVHETSGLTWLLTNGTASYIRLLGGYRAVWTEGGNARTAGACPTPNPMTRPFYWLTMIPPATPTDPDGWWCLYSTDADSLLLHPVTSTSGYVIAPPGTMTFGPDLVRVSPTSLKVVYAGNAGETPDSIVVVTVNTAAARTVLGTATPPSWVEPSGPPVPPGSTGGGGGGGGGGVVIPTRVLPAVPPPSRRYPHVDGITDWRAQQSVRLLWDQSADLSTRVDAAHASLADVTATMATQADVAALRKAVGEALALAQQSALGMSGVGSDGAPLTGPGSKAEPIVPMTADPVVCEDQIKRSLAYYGRVDYNYWAIQIHIPGPWQGGDKKYYMGWDAYWEQRAAPGDTGSADHALLPLPAVHQDPVPAGYPSGGWR